MTEPSSALGALESAITSYQRGDLGGWELDLVRRRMIEESSQRSEPAPSREAVLEEAATRVQPSQTPAPETQWERGYWGGLNVAAGIIRALKKAAPQVGTPGDPRPGATTSAPAGAAPDVVSVPREPTAEMLAAGSRYMNGTYTDYLHPGDCYRAMLAAAPSSAVCVGRDRSE